jgi:N-acyl homoserine lactone hydrolase
VSKLEETIAAPVEGALDERGGAVKLFLFYGGAIQLPLRAVKLGQGNDGELVTSPVPFYVVTHPRGNVVIDGGNAPEVAVDAVGHWGAIATTSTVIMSSEDALLPSLERVGIDPESIRWVLQTHLHIDHTGALAVIDRLPNAQVLVTHTEHAWAHAPDSQASAGYCRADFVKPGIDWAMLEETDDGYDLFGDGTIRCWRTPGHSPGHQSFEVRVSSGATYMLIGDAAWSIDHLEERALPVVSDSAPDSLRSVRKLRRLAWRSEATSIAGHDPEQWPSLKHAPEFYG